MSQETTPPTTTTATPDSRATEFSAVQGTKEQYKGETLLVYAYAGIWLILMVWLFTMWRSQRAIRERIDGLEAAIDRAASKRGEPKAAAEKKVEKVESART